MAFSGHTTPQVAINSTANANPYTGTITVGGPSDLVVLFVHGWTPGSGGEVPTTWTVTLDGSAITPTDHASSSAVSNGVAIYELTGLSAGSHALSVAYPAAGRACQALAWVISGHDATTPVANRAIATTYNSDVASRGYSTTTSRDGNVILSMVGVRRSIVTSEFSLSGGTLIGADATPGGVDTSDVTMAYGYHEVATAGSVTDTYSWTEAGRVHLPFVEVNIATGGGGASVTTGAGSATTQGLAPSAGAGATADAGVGAVAVQGFAPTAAAGADASAAPGLGAVTVQGFAPTATANVNAAPGAGALTLQGAAPTVTVGGAATADAGKGAVALQGSAPTASAGVTIATGRGTITVQGFAPTVASGAGVSVTTGAGAIAVQGFAPVAGAGVIASAGFGTITVQGRAPFAAAGIVSTRRHATIAEAANGGTFPRPNGGSIIRG